MILNTGGAGNEMMQNLSGTDLAAYLEIIENFTSHGNTRMNVDRVIALAAQGSDAPISESNVVAPAPISAEIQVDNLRVRTGPSLESTICGLAAIHTPVQVVGQADGGLWSQVNFDDALDREYANCGDKMFVITSALSGRAGTAPAIVAKPVQSQSKGVVINAYYMNVRTSAPAGRILRVLGRGDQVQIIGSKKLTSSARASGIRYFPTRGGCSDKTFRFRSEWS